MAVGEEGIVCFVIDSPINAVLTLSCGEKSIKRLKPTGPVSHQNTVFCYLKKSCDRYSPS